MDGVSAGRPVVSEEYHPYYDQYIRLVPDGDILATLERQIAETQQCLAGLTSERAARRPAPGEWNATEIVGHLADTERIYAYRALRIARGDMTPPEGIDFEAYAAASGYADRSLPDVIAELAATRAATLAWLRGLGAGAGALRAPERLHLSSVRAHAYFFAGHELHHLADLRRYWRGVPTIAA